MTPSTVDKDCGAVLVCFNPPPGLRQRIQGLLTQVGRLVVVDNGAPGAVEAELAGLERTDLIRNGRNAGIAAALNQGLDHLRGLGYRWALLLDHDSQPAATMIPVLMAAATMPGDNRGAIYVPRIRYALPQVECRWPKTADHRRYWFKRIYANTMTHPTHVDLAISSGMLLDLAKLDDLGRFVEAMFIDLVDTELCLRTRERGLRVVAVPAAELRHAIGETREERALGVLRVYPTHHAPIRHYYLARNRVHLWKRYGRVFPSWAAFELISGLKLLAKSLMYESDRWTKLRLTIVGTYHGLTTPAPMPKRPRQRPD